MLNFDEERQDSERRISKAEASDLMKGRSIHVSGLEWLDGSAAEIVSDCTNDVTLSPETLTPALREGWAC